jgi:hypothetical protein
LGSNETRARPVRSPPPTNVEFRVETEITLTPSLVLTFSMGPTVMLKLMLPASDQRCSARRAAPSTSLPALMLAGGLRSELPSWMLMVELTGQRIWSDDVVNW